VGRGLLLHTTDGGASWTEIDKQKINSGQGKFRWGPHGDRIYSWDEVGPIRAVASGPRYIGNGKSRMEVWLTSDTGIYHSEDDGETWNRSTPRPDDPTQPEIYAHFSGFADLEAFTEIYAVGWQGIAHWSSRTAKWELQMPAYSYMIGGIWATDGLEQREVWAVGQQQSGKAPYGAIYHLKWPENKWEKLTPTGPEGQPWDAPLSGIVLINPNLGFAVGTAGVILKGSKDKAGAWVWSALPSPPNSVFYSLAYDVGKDTLWIVGNLRDKNVVLSSKNHGHTWNTISLTDELGHSPPLNRVRYTGPGAIWVLGDGVVYKLRKEPDKEPS
jgi:hypothetical protein